MPSKHKQGTLSIFLLNSLLMFAKRPVFKTRLDFNPLIHQAIGYEINIYILTITLIHTRNLVGITASGRQQVEL
jgi:hypothetical protein